jgi:hypothetical protein
MRVVVIMLSPVGVPKTNHTCQQKPNPFHETVPLNGRLFKILADFWISRQHFTFIDDLSKQSLFERLSDCFFTHDRNRSVNIIFRIPSFKITQMYLMFLFNLVFHPGRSDRPLRDYFGRGTHYFAVVLIVSNPPPPPQQPQKLHSTVLPLS